MFCHIFVGLHILSTVVAYLCVIAVQHFLNDPHGEINTSNLPVPVSFNTAVRGVINSMNTSSLEGTERARKASEVRKKMVKFSNQKCWVYRCTFVMQHPSTPIKRGSNGPAYEMRKKRQKKRRKRKEEKMWDHIAKKKQQKKPSPCAYIFPP